MTTKEFLLKTLKEIYDEELKLTPPSSWTTIQLFWKHYINRVEKEL